MRTILVLLLLPISLVGFDLEPINSGILEDADCGIAATVSQSYYPINGQLIDVDDNLNLNIQFIKGLNNDKEFNRRIRLAGVSFKQRSKEERDEVKDLISEWIKDETIEIRFTSDEFLRVHEVPPALVSTKMGSVNYSVLKCGYGTVSSPVPNEIDEWVECVFEKVVTERIKQERQEVYTDTQKIRIETDKLYDENQPKEVVGKLPEPQEGSTESRDKTVEEQRDIPITIHAHLDWIEVGLTDLFDHFLSNPHDRVTYLISDGTKTAFKSDSYGALKEKVLLVADTDYFKDRKGTKNRVSSRRYSSIHSHYGNIVPSPYEIRDPHEFMDRVKISKDHAKVAGILLLIQSNSTLNLKSVIRYYSDFFPKNKCEVSLCYIGGALRKKSTINRISPLVDVFCYFDNPKQNSDFGEFVVQATETCSLLKKKNPDIEFELCLAPSLNKEVNVLMAKNVKRLQFIDRIGLFCDQRRESVEAVLFMISQLREVKAFPQSVGKEDGMKPNASRVNEDQSEQDSVENADKPRD